MSRVGKNPVQIPAGVTVNLANGVLSANGKVGQLSMAIMPGVAVDVVDTAITVRPNNETKRARQAWGATRALINNMMIGVSAGYERKLEINGVGYRAQLQGQTLKLALGYSHDIEYPVPSDVTITVIGDRNNALSIKGASKQRVGQVASEIRAYRSPEPYKGKGVKYAEETILRKEGKKK